jgi:glycine dehydrogenase
MNSIHPFAPLDQRLHDNAKKVRTSIKCDHRFCTTLQPNSGAQGEYAGLMTIRAYHLSRGDDQRIIFALLGTNPASAAMAGMKIIVTKTMENGNIDVEDVREKALQYKDQLSCLMITYPTHGVFESAIREITQIIHDNGGLVHGRCEYECTSGIN